MTSEDIAAHVLRFGGATPKPEDRPDADIATSRRLREAAALLNQVAAQYEASAGLKRALMRFGMGSDKW